MLPALLSTLLRLAAPNVAVMLAQASTYSNVVFAGAVVSLQTNLVVTFTTALIAPLGPGAIAGYHTGARLEYMPVPLVSASAPPRSP